MGAASPTGAEAPASIRLNRGDRARAPMIARVLRSSEPTTRSDVGPSVERGVGIECHGRVAQARPWQKRGSGGGQGASWEGEESALRPPRSKGSAILDPSRNRAVWALGCLQSVVGTSRRVSGIVWVAHAPRYRRCTGSSMAAAWGAGCRRSATPAANNAPLQGCGSGEG